MNAISKQGKVLVDAKEYLKLEKENEKLRDALIEIRDFEHNDHLDVIGNELKELAKERLEEIE